MERMQRRWSVLTPQDVQTICDSTPLEKYRKDDMPSMYKPALSDRLVGHTYLFEFDQVSYQYTFTALRQLTWSAADGAVHQEPCEVLPVPGTDDMFFVQHYITGSVPPQGRSIVIDLTNGTVTLTHAQIGVPASAREVQRDFLFGTIQGLYQGSEKHAFSDGLIGKAINWFYTPDFAIKHIYSMPLYYSYVMKMPDKCWMASNPADYVHLRDNIYIFSFVEERQAGVQGFFVINLDVMHDVGSFFGLQTTGLECCTFGARGEYSTMETRF